MPGPVDQDLVETLVAQVARLNAECGSLRSLVEELSFRIESMPGNSVDNILDRAGGESETIPTCELFYGADRYFIEGMTSDTRGTSLGTWKRFLVVDHLSGTVRLTSDAMPVPCGSGEHWYDLSKSSGPIHIPLFS